MSKNDFINIVVPAFDDAEVTCRKRRVLRLQTCARTQNRITRQPLYDV